MLICQCANVPIGCAIFNEDMPNGNWHIDILAHYAIIYNLILAAYDDSQ